MRKRIEELAEGKIPYEQPQVIFSKEKLELEVVEGQTATDSFQIKSENGIRMRGMIYSSNIRMKCLTFQFEGEEADIQVQFRADGMSEGEIAVGELCVVCNGGEYQLSFAVTVTRLYAEASTGKIKNLRDFVKLAKSDWKEAYHIFHSPAFKNILAPKDLKASLLYEGLSKPSITEQTMDEFLIGIGKKERVRFLPEKHSVEVFEAAAPIEEQLLIQKEGWGFLEIRITASEEFIVPQKRYITDADFMGSTYPLSFYIDTEQMHAGNNFGCIYLENDVQKEEYQVWASADSIQVRKERTVQGLQRATYLLTKSYINFRLKKIVTGEWTKQTLALIQRMQEFQPNDPWYLLFQAYALQRNKQRQDAQWLMDEFRQKNKGKKDPQWAFYDYLCLQKEKEPIVVDRLLDEIEEIAKRYGTHPMIFFLTLRLNGTLRTQPQVKLRVMEARIMQGQYSPLWYVEAFTVYQEQPYLLTKLDRYEVLLMNWASRQGVLTKDLADQVMRLANNMRQFQPLVCRILFRSYEKNPDEDMLAGVCAYLIKGHCYQPKYHHWYEKGITENLKITGLYEAFLLTMDLHHIQPLPKVIQMYFQYNNQLPYPYKAALYANIIAHKETQPVIYEKYSETMKQFAIDEILKGHMDDNLAVVYDEILDKGILTQELAGPLADILYTHKFYCMNKMAAFVVIIQKHMKEEQRVPISGELAYFQLFSNDYAILLENNRGQRFVSPESCQLEKLMKPSHYIRRCLNLAPQKLQFLMHHMDGKTDLSVPVKTDVEFLRILMEAPQISEKFKSQIGPGLVRYCLINQMEEGLDAYLMQVDFAAMRADNRNLMIELMIDRGWNEKAFELVSSYGYAGIGRQKLAHLITYMLRARDIGEDAFLLELCMAVLERDVQNAVIVSYLAKYYEGPSKQMMRVYQAAQLLEIKDTAELEERLLIQTLYSTEYVDRIQEVYLAYRAHNGREFIIQAYRSYCMHEYVVHDMILPASLFLEACQLYKEGRLRGIVCRLGLLKYFSETDKPDRYQLKMADELLNEFISTNMNFAFFNRLPDSLCRKYQLYNRKVVEYHARPDSKIAIHYRMPKQQQEFTASAMSNRYDGIFTWEFLLFRDDEVEYYITEETENGTQQLGESNRITGAEYRDIRYGGRYAYINHMLYLREQGNERDLLRTMQEYEKLSILSSKMFKII
uniref:DUF5717 domain-containing protein n=1 Tax=Eubacterium plexicaudatum ASF492 TaxID=1235802 RepID=N2AS15_9FIRM